MSGVKDLKTYFLSNVADVMFTQTLCLCDRWAENRRRMQGGEPYDLEASPYLREILNSRASKNWVMKAAQTRLTESAITRALFELDFSQKDCIYYFPTGKMAERFSKTRFSSAIHLSPYLSSVCSDSVELKQIGPATLHVLGANSIANLKGTAAGRLFFDELDEWTEQQIYLAEERASGQKDSDKIIWGFSTPKYPNLGIHKQFLNSTQEHFFFDCPHCHEEIELLWEDSFHLEGEYVDDPKIHDSYIKCSKCQGKLPHETKGEWLAGGRWKATNLDADPTISRGFWVSQLYSPTAAPWEIANKFLRGRGDEAARREFYNSVLGLPFLEDAFQVNDVHIDDCIGDFSIQTARPKSAADSFITLGIDQGGQFHHWTALDWKFHRGRIGDPNDRGTPRMCGFGQVLQDDWPQIHGLMRTYQVRMCVIDYFPEPTNARKFARKFPEHVYLCQRVVGRTGREVTLEEDDYGANLVKVDKVGWLTKALGRIMIGDIELPIDVSIPLREQLKNICRTMVPSDDGYVAKFVSIGEDHFADSLSYAEIALKVLDPSLHTG